MNNIPASSSQDIPSINILDADGTSALFDGGEVLPIDMFSPYDLVSGDASFNSCSRGLQPEYFPLNNPFPNSSSELEDMPELSHLSTTNQLYMTGPSYSFPYSGVLQENAIAPSVDGGLSPSSLGSPVPSPTSSFTSSLSPLSFYDSIPLSDSESPISPSPATPDQVYFWPSQVQGLNNQSSDSLAFHPSFMGSSDSIPSLDAPTHRRSRSSPSARREPVASKAMLEANSRRRRHPAQFECPDCRQTFTALFSLKRHSQSHTGERPFACGIPGCSQRFYNSSDCKRHEKSKKRHKNLPMQ